MLDEILRSSCSPKYWPLKNAVNDKIHNRQNTSRLREVKEYGMSGSACYLTLLHKFRNIELIPITLYQLLVRFILFTLVKSAVHCSENTETYMEGKVFALRYHELSVVFSV